MRSNGLGSEHIYITLDTHECIVANSIIPLQRRPGELCRVRVRTRKLGFELVSHDCSVFDLLAQH